LLGIPLAFAQDSTDDDDEDMVLPAPSASPMRMSYDFSGMELSGELGVTQGGAQDIGYFRDRVDAGEVPHPRTITPEGLFSEHDLPIESRSPCHRLFCAHGEAMQTSLLVREDTRYLAQIGFATMLTEDTFQRPPLNLVAVVDKSGSMGGQPIETVRAALMEVVDRHLRPGDQLSIVTYGSSVSVHMGPTTDRKAMRAGVRSIAIQGSTNLEAGLSKGFEVAHETRRGFDGTTRVMLFTDERPNTGRTDAASFMGMAEGASQHGVGMTTIGVGVQFGAELATKVSSVRGGNLFFFPDARKMREVFADDFDTMVVELAYDMVLEVSPTDGLKVDGVYGVPGDAIEWTEDGAIRMEVATLFLSKRAGAIYVAFASGNQLGQPASRVRVGDTVGSVFLDYEPRDGARAPTTVALPLAATSESGIGLRRGRVLVDEVTTLKKATSLHHENNDQEGAYQLVHQLASVLRSDRDPELESERALVFRLEDTLAHLSGHRGERGAENQAGLDPVTNLPRRHP
ncbi:MAG: VWA domain-containing protein, partial [Deltaproteobacteria bacterium]|nr:VWA domain-containing protein [Deltaproteobacteria bacterium]